MAQNCFEVVETSYEDFHVTSIRTLLVKEEFQRWQFLFLKIYGSFFFPRFEKTEASIIILLKIPPPRLQTKKLFLIDPFALLVPTFDTKASTFVIFQ